MSLFTDYPDREPMTEAEARRVGLAATRILQLRHILANSAAGSSFTVATSNGSQALALSALDTRAALALLIEREAQFLSSFNVIIDKAAA